MTRWLDLEAALQGLAGLASYLREWLRGIVAAGGRKTQPALWSGKLRVKKTMMQQRRWLSENASEQTKAYADRSELPCPAAEAIDLAP